MTAEQVELHRKVTPPGKSYQSRQNPYLLITTYHQWNILSERCDDLGNRGQGGIRDDIRTPSILAGRSDSRRKAGNGQLVMGGIHHTYWVHRGKDTGQLCLKNVVLIPKGNGEFWGIGLVAVICKAVSVVANRWIRASVNFHESLNGFQAGRVPPPSKSSWYSSWQRWGRRSSMRSSSTYGRPSSP